MACESTDRGVVAMSLEYANRRDTCRAGLSLWASSPIIGGPIRKLLGTD